MFYCILALTLTFIAISILIWITFSKRVILKRLTTSTYPKYTFTHPHPSHTTPNKNCPPTPTHLKDTSTHSHLHPSPAYPHPPVEIVYLLPFTKNISPPMPIQLHPPIKNVHPSHLPRYTHKKCIPAPTHPKYNSAHPQPFIRMSIQPHPRKIHQGELNFKGYFLTIHLFF